MRRAVRYATNLILQLKQSNVWTTKSHPPVAIWCWRIIQKSRETPPIWARAVYVLTSPVSLPPFRGMLTWKFANKRTFGDRYPSSYTVKHTVICEIIGERSTLSREHFLYIVRVVCISFWTTSRLLLLLALRVLHQTDSNASLISLSNEFLHGWWAQYTRSFQLRILSAAPLLGPFTPASNSRYNRFIYRDAPATDVLFINFYASSLLGPSYSLERRRRNPSCRARASETLFYY